MSGITSGARVAPLPLPVAARAAAQGADGADPRTQDSVTYDALLRRATGVGKMEGSGAPAFFTKIERSCKDLLDGIVQLPPGGQIACLKALAVSLSALSRRERTVHGPDPQLEIGKLFTRQVAPLLQALQPDLSAQDRQDIEGPVAVSVAAYADDLQQRMERVSSSLVLDPDGTAPPPSRESKHPASPRPVGVNPQLTPRRTADMRPSLAPMAQETWPSYRTRILTVSQVFINSLRAFEPDEAYTLIGELADKLYVLPDIHETQDVPDVHDLALTIFTEKIDPAMRALSERAAPPAKLIENLALYTRIARSRSAQVREQAAAQLA